MPHYRNKHNINLPELNRVPQYSIVLSAANFDPISLLTIFQPSLQLYQQPTSIPPLHIVTQPSSVSKVLSNSYLLAILAFFLILHNILPISSELY